MSKFDVGDLVQMPGTPFVIEVLEIARCLEESDPGGCKFGGETFRFKDPGGQGDDWEHTSFFEKIA